MSSAGNSVRRVAQKKGTGVSKIKLAIRSISRLLNNPKLTLPDEARARKQAELDQLNKDLAAAESAAKNNEVDSRYKMVRFFESKKVKRILFRVKKSLAALLIDLNAPPTLAELKLRHEAADLEERLIYIEHYPSGTKYQSILLPTQDAKNHARRLTRLEEVLAARNYKRDEYRMIGVGENAGFTYERRFDYGEADCADADDMPSGRASNDSDDDDDDAPSAAAVAATAAAAGVSAEKSRKRSAAAEASAAPAKRSTAAKAVVEKQEEGEGEEDEEAKAEAKRARKAAKKAAAAAAAAADEEEVVTAKKEKKDKKEKKEKKEKKALKETWAVRADVDDGEESGPAENDGDDPFLREV